jgi:hypothetical protein
MLRNVRSNALVVFAILVLCLSGLETVNAGSQKDMGGWESGSPYNKFYDASELDSFKARIVKVTEVVPMPGMSRGVALHVKESPDDEVIVVHVCPTWYMKSGGIGLKRGDRVKVRGVWAEINGKDVFLASKIKKGNYFVLKVRLTKDGTPFWTMSEDEVNKEKTAVGSE